MNSESELTKALCAAFKLNRVEWLPASVRTLLFYLLENPSSLVDGNILFININKQKINVQLLSIITGKGEIIAEKQETFPYDEVSCLPEKLMSYAVELGIYKKGLWDIDFILLVTDEEKDDFIDKLMTKSWNTMPILSISDKLQTKLQELTDRYSGPTFNSVLVVYPRRFYIEKAGTETETTQLEFIPFASDLLAMNITQRYKIFSFAAKSQYNLSWRDDLLRIKIYEKPIDSTNDNSDLKLVLEETREINKNHLINIYLNLPRKRLEVDCSLLSASDNILQELHKSQQSGYDFIKESQLLNTQLISDFDQHLKHQNIPDSSKHTSKTVYYRALSLLSLLSNKK
ncbi:MAG: hypothetical protein GX808_07910 [Syntrophomonadaceae bacterium]|jgi:hypothetical protein|nr:hypothetical protein [Syntrophomonadaceae bacterium]